MWSRLPHWGTASGGGWCELPMPGHLTAVRGSSSSQKTMPTPVADNSRGLPSKGTDYASLANTAASLLPTPAVNDMGRNKTPEQWDDWTQRMRDKHGNGNGHGKPLEIEAQRLLPTPTSRDHKDGAAAGANVPINALLGRTVWALAPTRQPSDGGNTPSTDQHPHPPSPQAGTGDTDSAPPSLNG